jgi:transcription elongation GreA/GreB family factor
MGLPPEWDTMEAGAQEEWFLGGLDADPLPFDELVSVLLALVENSHKALANDWAEMVQETLVQRRDRDSMAVLMTAEMKWRADDTGFKPLCHRALKSVFRNRSDKEIVGSAGFDKSDDVATCMGRINLLLGLQPGALVLDNTWGFGVVKKVDDFYMKIVIDFEGKPQHSMTFGYAAEALTLLSEDHVLTLRHRDPDELARRIKEDPAEIVRMILRSYGDMPAPQLREILEDGIVDPAKWKPFWDGARRGLKNDDLVEIPVKRTENIRLLASAKQYAAAWFDALQAERDCETILELVHELEDATDTSALDESARSVLADRLAFAALGTELRAPQVAAAACTAADRLGATDGDPGEKMRMVLGRFLDRGRFIPMADALPARELKPVIGLLHKLFDDDLATRLVDVLDGLSIRLLDEVVPHLIEQGREASVGVRFREIFDADSVAATTVCWLCRNLDFVDRNQPVSREDLLFRSVRVFDSPCSAHALRAQNLLRGLFEQQAWMDRILGSITELGREGFTRRVNAASCWDPTESRGVLARVLKTFPELKRITEAASDDESDEPIRARLTSWRSFRERQAVLKKLVEVDIPENSKEIGVAISYGDLRENFEYQSAKDRQGILMQRKGELEADLSMVKATDFKNVPADMVGMATCIWMAGGDGEEQRLCILGEWDRDEDLGIVGSGSGVAEKLLGKKPGDTIQLPETIEIGSRRIPAGECRITRITPIDDDIREWMEGR